MATLDRRLTTLRRALGALIMLWAGGANRHLVPRRASKFNAPSLSLPVAMDGSRQEFGVPQSGRDRPLRS